jgi:hypothetical protein
LALPETKPGLLNSWKEIATYLGRGVRTAQRWERLGLPVRRVSFGPRSPVIAHAPDIDSWLRFSGQQTFETLTARRQQVQTCSERAARKIHASLPHGATSVSDLTKIILDEFDEVHTLRLYD